MWSSPLSSCASPCCRRALSSAVASFPVSRLTPPVPRARQTRICLFFLEGTCPFGSRCLYAHGSGELHHDVLGGAPATDPVLNPKFKTRLCRWYASGQKCPHSLRCAWAL